jgi:hypothetical protein
LIRRIKERRQSFSNQLLFLHDKEAINKIDDCDLFNIIKDDVGKINVQNFEKTENLNNSTVDNDEDLQIESDKTKKKIL